MSATRPQPARALAAADALGARLSATRTEPATNPQLEALALAVTANQPVLLWGEPGIGKSAGMEQLATALGVRLETVIASVHEPSDFAGLPIVGEDPATTGVPMAPPDWAVRLARTGHGLLFFDELSSAPPAVQAALLRVVLERRVGSLELPAAVRIVASTGRTTRAPWPAACPVPGPRWRSRPSIPPRPPARSPGPAAPSPASSPPGRAWSTTCRPRPPDGAAAGPPRVPGRWP